MTKVEVTSISENAVRQMAEYEEKIFAEQQSAADNAAGADAQN